MTQAAHAGEQSGAFGLPVECGKINLISDLIDHFPVALYVCDLTGALHRFNERAAGLWGWSGAEATAGAAGDAYLAPPDGGVAAEAIRTGEAVREHEFIVDRPDGSQAVLMASAEPIFGEDGAAIGVVGSLHDVTQRRKIDLQQKELLNELNHRVKNTLSTVQLLAGLTIRKCGMPKEVQDDFECRLIALSRAHDQVTRQRWAPVDLRTIVQTAIEPYCEHVAESVDIRGEAIEVGSQSSLTLAMIFHELASNAAKYGALSSAQGRLAVSWSIANGVRAPTLVITWQETGGPSVSEPERLGFGARLLQHGITRQFKGATRLDYDPSGLRCTMEIPLPSTPGS